jgi:uncharacterized phage infection (PIP) family protein YhgE
MATALPQFKMRQLARRGGGADITSLAAAYKSQSDALTSQYQTEFDKYQKNVAATMAPYQAQLEQYKSTIEPQYQSALASYNQKLNDYQRQLAEINANPVTERIQREVVDVTWYGKKKYGDVTYYDPKPIPTFEEKAPDLPNAPVAPEIAQFDSTQVEEKRKQIGSDFRREVSERKSSRMAAVQRKSRTLLGGVSA